MVKDFEKREAEICLNCPYKKCISKTSENGCGYYKTELKKILKDFNKLKRRNKNVKI